MGTAELAPYLPSAAAGGAMGGRARRASVTNAPLPPGLLAQVCMIDLQNAGI